MSKTLDGLIAHVIDAVALKGQYGALSSDFVLAVRSYYDNEGSSLDDSSRKIDPQIQPRVDQPLLEYVWGRLIRHPDIEVAGQGRARTLTLTEALGYDRSDHENVVQTPGSKQNQGPLAISTSSVAETRHSSFQRDKANAPVHGTADVAGPATDDPSISASQSASRESNETTSKTLTSIHGGGQHPASKDQSSDASKNGPKSSDSPRLYASEQSVWQAITGHGPDLQRVKSFDFTLLSIIAVSGPKGIAQHDIVRLSGQDKRSLPHRTDRLHDDGYIVKERVTLVVQGHGGLRKLNTSLCTLKRFSKLPEHLKEIERLRKEAMEKVTAKRTRNRKFLKSKLLSDDDNENSTRHDVSAEDLPSDGLSSLRYRKPQWVADRGLTNQIYEVVDACGTIGATLPDIRQTLFGQDYKKPIEYWVSRMVDAWQISQPLDLRHLAIVRDTVLRSKSPVYIHFTYPNFQKMVEAGTTSWDAVITIAQNVKLNNNVDTSLESQPKLDALGFVPIREAAFEGEHNNESLARCAGRSQIAPVLPTTKPISAFKEIKPAKQSESEGQNPVLDTRRQSSNQRVTARVPKRKSNNSRDVARPDTANVTPSPAKRLKTSSRGQGRPRKLFSFDVPTDLHTKSLEQLRSLKKTIENTERYQLSKIINEVERRVAPGTAVGSVIDEVLEEMEPKFQADGLSPLLQRLKGLTIHKFMGGPFPASINLEQAIDAAVASRTQSKASGRQQSYFSQAPYLPSVASHTLRIMEWPKKTFEVPKPGLITNDNINEPSVAVAPVINPTSPSQQPVTQGANTRKRKLVLPAGLLPKKKGKVVKESSQPATPAKRRGRPRKVVDQPLLTYYPSIAAHSGSFLPFAGQKSDTIPHQPHQNPPQVSGSLSSNASSSLSIGSRHSVTKHQSGAIAPIPIPEFAQTSQHPVSAVTALERRYKEQLSELPKIQKGAFVARRGTFKRRVGEPTGMGRFAYQLVVFRLETLRSREWMFAPRRLVASSKSGFGIPTEEHTIETDGVQGSRGSEGVDEVIELPMENIRQRAAVHNSSHPPVYDIHSYDPMSSAAPTKSQSTVIGFQPVLDATRPSQTHQSRDTAAAIALAAPHLSPSSFTLTDVVEHLPTTLSSKQRSAAQMSEYSRTKLANADTLSSSEPNLNEQNDADQSVRRSDQPSPTVIDANNVAGASQCVANQYSSQSSNVPLQVPSKDESRSNEASATLVSTKDHATNHVTRTQQDASVTGDQLQQSVAPIQRYEVISQGDPGRAHAQPAPSLVDGVENARKMPKDSSRKETIQRDDGKVAVAPLQRTGGSTAMLRKTIVMDLVHKADGACPGYKELTVPFAVEWNKRGQRGEPEMNTVRTVVNSLVSAGKLRQLNFAYQTPEGLTKTKVMLTLTHIDPDDVKVQHVKAEMIQAGKRSYLPPQWLVPDGEEESEVVPEYVPWGKKGPSKHVYAYQRYGHHQNLIKQKKRQEQKLLESKKQQERLSLLKALIAQTKREERERARQEKLDTKKTPSQSHSSPRQIGRLDSWLGGKGWTLSGRGPLMSNKRAASIIRSPSLQLQGTYSHHSFQNSLTQTWQPVAPRSRPERNRQAFHIPLPSSLRPKPPKRRPSVLPMTVEFLSTDEGEMSLPEDSSSEDFDFFTQTVPEDGYRSVYSDLAARQRLAPTIVRPLTMKGRPNRSKPGIRKEGYHQGYIPSYMAPQQPFHAPSGTFATEFSGLMVTVKYFSGTNKSGWSPAYLDAKPLTAGVEAGSTHSGPLTIAGKTDFHTQVNQLARWEKVQSHAEGVQYPKWTFIHYYYPHRQLAVAAESSIMDEARIYEVSKESGRLVGRPMVLSTGGSLARDAHSSMSQQFPFLGGKRRHSVRSSGEESEAADDEHEDRESVKTPKRVRHRRRMVVNRAGSLKSVEERRLMMAVIAVRCLTGGVQKRCNWSLIAQACGASEDRIWTTKWREIQEKYGQGIEKAEEDFQQIFLKAYQDGVVPDLDFNNVGSFPWQWLVEWTLQNSKPPQVITSLPRQRSALSITDAFVETPEHDMNRYYELDGAVTRESRRVSLYRHAWTQPASEGVTPSEDKSDVLAAAKTWVRANIVASNSESYDSDLARFVLLRFPEQTIERALDSLILDKIVTYDHKKSRYHRRYVINEQMLATIDRTFTATDLQRAVHFKAYLDLQIAANGSLEWSPHAQNGDVIAILNLLANHRITLQAKDVPRNAMGFMNGGYETKSMDKTKLYCKSVIVPTDNYVEGSLPLVPPPPPPPSKHLDGENHTGQKIPLWYDIHGNLVDELWERALTGVLCIINTRPGSALSQLVRMTKPVLDVWEVEWIVEWIVEAGVGTEWFSSGERRFRTREWWWCVLASGAEDGVGFTDDKLWYAIEEMEEGVGEQS